MKEYHYYECSYCGEQFGYEDDCERHELMVHTVQSCQSLILLNEIGIPMKKEFDTLDNARYIIWLDDKGLSTLKQWAYLYYGYHSHCFSDYHDSTGHLYLDTAFDEWYDFVDLEEKYLEKKDILAPYILDKSN